MVRRLATSWWARGAMRPLFPSLAPFLEPRKRHDPPSRRGTLLRDRLGRPCVSARSAEDGWWLLGWAVGQDRAEQLDWMRRAAWGQLSEIVGPAAVEHDVRRRLLAPPALVRDGYEQLPLTQRVQVDSYAAGVAAALACHERPPLMQALGVPGEFGPLDSVAALMQMFDVLGGEERGKRTWLALSQRLPEPLVGYLCPTFETGASAVDGQAAGDGPPPVDLGLLLKARSRGPFDLPTVLPAARQPSASNAWAVAGSRTTDGRAWLCNDLHLALATPGPLYAASLEVAGRRVGGVLHPMMPVFLAGATPDLAWGVSNLCADNLDLVLLDEDETGERYQTSEGWRSYETERVAMGVRGEPPREVVLQRTVWGPVCTQPLCGERVVLRWAGGQPQAIDLGLASLPEAVSLEEAVARARASGGPPLGVAFAHRDGEVAWTTSGRLVDRRAQPYLPARSRALAPVAPVWLAAADHPTCLRPASGLVAHANHAPGLGPPVGRNFAPGWRAKRIVEVLKQRPLTRGALAGLQLDEEPGFWSFYRDLARETCARAHGPGHRAWGKMERALRGALDPRSDVLAILMRFRDLLAQGLFATLLADVQALSEEPIYGWGNIEPPLRDVLSRRAALPCPFGPPHDSWEAFLQEALRRAQSSSWPSLQAGHPLGRPLGLSWWLDYPAPALRGHPQAVRLANPSHGVAMRMGACPGALEQGWLVVFAGVSEDPRHPSFSDQFRAWHEGTPIFFPGTAEG
jgi:penicillin amidase